jgi:hypothetical protein
MLSFSSLFTDQPPIQALFDNGPEVAIDVSFVSVEPSQLQDEALFPDGARVLDLSSPHENGRLVSMHPADCVTVACQQLADQGEFVPRLKTVFAVVKPGQDRGYLRIVRQIHNPDRRETTELGFVLASVPAVKDSTQIVRSKKELWIAIAEVAVLDVDEARSRALSWTPIGQVEWLSQLEWCPDDKGNDCTRATISAPAEDLIYNTRLDSDEGG